MSIDRKKLVEFFGRVYNPIYMNVIIENVERFTRNEKSIKKQQILLDIVTLMQWINDSDIYGFISSKVIDITGEFDYVINFKQDSTSSSTGIINMLIKETYLFPEDIINIHSSNYKNIIYSCHNKKILLIDDFSGTGTTFIKCLKKIIKHVEVNVIIVCFAWTKQALDNIIKFCDDESKILSLKVFRKEDLIIKRYDEIYSKNTLDYIDYIVNKYLHEEFKYGYENSGTVVSIGGISPNNNIPLIWDNQFKFDDDRRWIPLLNRSIKQEVIAKYKEIVFKSKKEYIFSVYKSYSLPNIDFNDFQTLYILKLFGHKNIPIIIEICGFDSEVEFERNINELIRKGYLTISDNLFFITNKEMEEAIEALDDYIIESILNTIKLGKKKISNKFITENFILNRFK